MKSNLFKAAIAVFGWCMAASALVPLQLHHSTNNLSSESSSRRKTPTKLLMEKSSKHLIGGENALLMNPSLNPLETWCITHMDVWYSKSLSIKCPFFRRRMADLLDSVDMVMRFLVIRHKSLELIGPPPGCRSTRMSKVKNQNLSMNELRKTILKDWRQDTNKGYYITGRLNTTIYRDDCRFDGPDPDMPVRGLRKYLNAASNLFDHATSSAELISLDIVGQTTIEAKWKLEGVLHLPWHPKLPVWTGTTTYHFDDDGLVHLHEEAWDISVFQAFAKTLWPEVADLMWEDQKGPAKDQ